MPKIKNHLFGKNKSLILNDAFTLVELLIVMGIMAVMATFFISGYTGVQKKARDATRKSDLNQLAKAMELYFNDYRRYPPESSGQIAGCPSTSSTACVWGTGQFTDTRTIYYKSVPADPVPAQTYIFRTDANGTYYKFYAELENPDDPDIISVAENGCSAIPACNFAITSGNTTP